MARTPKSPFLYPSRRMFLKQALGGAAAASLLSPWDLLGKAYADIAGAGISPIQPVGLNDKQTDFNGDVFDRPHELLWDKDNYLKSRGGIPAPSERAEVVVIGGGMSGLLSAYALRKHRPIVLESAPNFGGNSRGERWGGTDYSIGAAYITVPDEGSSAETLLRELGLFERGRHDDSESAQVTLANSLRSGFWNGATDPSRAQEFRRARELFADVLENSYPDIPPTEESDLSADELAALDRVPFDQWLKSKLGTLHPHLDEFIHEYCWSSFAADPTEISSAQALNFLACDLGGTIAFPGGNSAITTQLFKKLMELPGGSARLRAGAVVIDVTLTQDGVRVCYEESERKLKTVIARTCIVACPKFAAGYMLSDLPGDQAYAMTRIKYRAYLVGNALIRGRIPSPGYDLFRLTGTVPTDPRAETNTRPFTDLVFANWAAQDSGPNTVLTFYKALPYEGARQLAYSPFFYQRHRAMIENELPLLLGGLGIPPKQIVDVRMTRWGHALPVAATGLYASGVLQQASAPVGDSIFFANQDCFANPSFESALSAAEGAVKLARARLL